MPKDDRPYITVHDGMPDHPKVEGLSDRAFRLLVECWCWCSRNKTDGHIKASSWVKRGPASARAELVAAGLMEDDLMGGVISHHYDQHQRTAEEIEAARVAKSDSGAYGNHKRHHLDKGVRNPGCPLCVVA